jgi:hypothetical protein
VAENTNQIVTLSDSEKASMVERKVTCPFVGSAVAQNQLAVRNDAKNPLAGIEDIRALGNSGGGDLGDLLVLFAAGNHAFMRGSAGKLDAPVPANLFSLELPGSQGSHPGHSGILQGNPEALDSGRFSQADFDRLLSHARDGLIKRSDVGRFIGENLIRDPKSKVADLNTAELLAGDVLKLVETAGSALVNKLFGSDKGGGTAHREVEEKLTKLTGENNLVGSAGEFGLLFAFVANKPDAKTVSGEPAVEVTDLKTMFIDKRLPVGWETWRKSRVDWVTNTTALLISAAKEYHKPKGHQ